jgi:signal transduction histidine kinase
MLFGATKRSPHAHARLARVDLSRALAHPGVVRVLTADDVPTENLLGHITADQPVFVRDIARCEGEAVAFVVATSQELAWSALDLIDLTWEPLPPITTIASSTTCQLCLTAAQRSAALARRLAAGDLDARLHPRGRDEIAALGRALDDMAEALGRTIHELDEAAERERSFSADVAHELRTPITGLVAASSLLDDTPEAVMVKERARALAHLVEDLLEVMRLDAGAETPMSQEFDLVRLVGDVARDRLPEAELVLPPTLRIESDPRRLERVLVNLMENARRYGAAPFQIVVDSETVTVTVRDSGPGFGPFLERAADRFAMASRDRGGGTGLGLAIAEGQSRVLGGDLELRDDGGAVATVRLPRTARVQIGAGLVGGPA